MIGHFGQLGTFFEQLGALYVTTDACTVGIIYRLADTQGWVMPNFYINRHLYYVPPLVLCTDTNTNTNTDTITNTIY